MFDRNWIWPSDRSIFVCFDVLNSILILSQFICIRVIYVVLYFIGLLEQRGKKMSNFRLVGVILKLDRFEDRMEFDRSIVRCPMSDRSIVRCQNLILLGFVLFIMGFDSYWAVDIFKI